MIPGNDADTTLHTVTGLTNGRRYSFRILAENSDGKGVPSSYKAATPHPAGSPARPTIYALPQGDGQVILSWTDPGGSGIMKWQYRRTYGTSVFGKWIDIPGSGPDTTTYTVKRLRNGRSYSFQVRAVNVDGKGGVGDVRAQLMLSPAARSFSLAKNVDGSTTPVALGSMTLATEDAIFLIYRLTAGDSGKFAVSPAGELSYIGSGEDYEGTRSYRLTVTTTTNDAYSATATLAVTVNVTDVPKPPPAPAAPTVTGKTSTSVTVTWTAPTVPAGTPALTGYDLRYRPAGSTGANWEDHDHSGTGTGATIGSLTPGAEYNVQVRAVNEEGTSGWSVAGTGGPNATPPDPGPSTTTPSATPSAVPSTAPSTTDTELEEIEDKLEEKLGGEEIPMDMEIKEEEIEIQILTGDSEEERAETFVKVIEAIKEVEAEEEGSSAKVTIILSGGDTYYKFASAYKSSVASSNAGVMGENALPEIEDGVTIRIKGNGAIIERDSILGCDETTSIEDKFRLFSVLEGGILSIEDATIRGGCVEGGGGGILSRGTLELKDVTLSGNEASEEGGAIKNVEGGVVKILSSTTITENIAESGGGIYNEEGSSIDIVEGTDTRIADNEGGNCEGF